MENMDNYTFSPQKLPNMTEYNATQNKAVLSQFSHLEVFFSGKVKDLTLVNLKPGESGC